MILPPSSSQCRRLALSPNHPNQRRSTAQPPLIEVETRARVQLFWPAIQVPRTARGRLGIGPGDLRFFCLTAVADAVKGSDDTHCHPATVPAYKEILMSKLRASLGVV